MIAEATALMARASREIIELREALEQIAQASTPDQPAASGATELEWVQQHVGKLRGIAARALAASYQRNAD